MDTFNEEQAAETSAMQDVSADALTPKQAAEQARITLSTGDPVTTDHREIDPATGMQKGYVVLSMDERRKGFVRPVRNAYTHEKCGGVTTIGWAIAETYARQPDFYSGTFCCGCRAHFPVGPNGEFVWKDTAEKVGT